VLGDLEVDDINRNPRAAADLNRFRDRFENSRAFGANVSRIDSAVLSRDFAHRYQRVGVNPNARRPAQRAGDAERALLHRFTDDDAHAVEFFSRGRASFVAVNFRPDRTGTEVRTNIGRDAAPQQFGIVTRKILPPFGRRGGTAFAEDHRSHALPHHTLGIAVFDNRIVGVVVNVNEAGRDDQAVRVNRARSRAVRQPPDGCDLTVAEADIADERRIARAVNHAAMANENVEVRLPVVTAPQQGEQQDRNNECSLHHPEIILFDCVIAGECTSEQTPAKFFQV